MKESILVRRIMAAVTSRYPAAYVRKLSDRFTRGLPDVLILFPRQDGTSGSLLVEAKVDKNVTSKIQEEEHAAITRAGGAITVAYTVAHVLEKLEDLGA
jgi:hypothetical protein